MRYRLALFDFDGTLADSFGWFASVLGDVADRHGFRRVEPSEIAELRRLDARQILTRLGVARWRLPLVAAHMRRLQAEADIQPFPGVTELIADLAGNGMRMAVVSSNAAANVRRVLGAETIARLDWLECGAGLFGKAGRLKSVLERSGLPAAQAIAIGDEIRDIEAARAAGLAAGAVAWGYTDPESLAIHGPDHLFRTPADLRATLLGDRPDHPAGATNRA